MIETFSIPDVEIFAVGTWNGDTYTEVDLDGMVDAFDRVSFRPSLKLGHNDEQKIADGLPSLGRVSLLRRLGNKLVANFIEVPKILANLIKNKAYTNVSCEVLFDYEEDGTEYDKLLTAVALLGTDIPAVSTLKEIEALYTKKHRDNKEIIFKSFMVKRIDHKKPEGDRDVPDKEKFEKEKKELEAKIAKMSKESKLAEEVLTAKLAEEQEKTASLEAKAKEFGKKSEENIKRLSKEEERIKNLEDSLVESKTQMASFREERRKEKNKAFIEKFTAEENFKILPYEKENVEFILERLTSTESKTETKKYSIGGSESDKSVVAVFKNFIEERKVGDSLFSELSKGGEKKKYANASMELAERTKAYMKENKVDFSKASIAVLKEDSNLSKRYNDQLN